jgi:hypothetical protein
VFVSVRQRAGRCRHHHLPPRSVRAAMSRRTGRDDTAATPRTRELPAPPARNADGRWERAAAGCCGCCCDSDEAGRTARPPPSPVGSGASGVQRHRHHAAVIPNVTNSCRTLKNSFCVKDGRRRRTRTADEEGRNRRARGGARGAACAALAGIARAPCDRCRRLLFSCRAAEYPCRPRAPRTPPP